MASMAYAGKMGDAVKHLIETCWKTVMPMHGWDLDQGKVLVHMLMGSIKCIEFIDKLNDHQLLRKDPVPWG
jgi:hypothetical protein